VVIAALGMIASASAIAQDYPSRPVRMIVPFAAGGPADLLARAIGPAISNVLRQPVVIENRAGAGGATGVDAVAKAEPDGYTIGITGPGALVAAPFMTKVPYDATRDLAPISRVATVNGVIVVASQSSYQTLADLIVAARAAPGKLSFGSAGAGTLTHLAGELLNLEAGIKLVHVPYRGAAPASADLLGGHIQTMLPDLPGVLPQIRAGTIRALAITSAKRSGSIPDTPTTAEAGLPNVISDSWYGLIAPAGLSADVRGKLNAAAAEALKDPAVIAQIAAQGAVVAPSTAQEFSDLIAAEQTRWKRVIEATGATL
jgi:tripartite-type tricarboxylate transporter receptor subunit TctC